MIKSLFGLEVFNISYKLALGFFNINSSLPKEERYSLTDQIVRSSWSVAALVAEGWRIRSYEKQFKKFPVYAIGCFEKIKVWLFFSRNCGYITPGKYSAFEKLPDESGSKIYKLYTNWKKL
jgi:four helix bundle protein